MPVKTTTTWNSLEDKKRQPSRQLRMSWIGDQINTGKVIPPIPTPLDDDLSIIYTWIDQAAANDYVTYMQQTTSAFNIPPPTITFETV